MGARAGCGSDLDLHALSVSNLNPQIVPFFPLCPKGTISLPAPRLRPAEGFQYVGKPSPTGTQLLRLGPQSACSLLQHLWGGRLS